MACTDKEREIIGPRLGTSLAKRAIDFQGSWKEAETSLARKDIGLTRHWNVGSEEFDYKLGSSQNMCCPCVGEDANTNLSGPQRELLAWHWKLSCSMTRVQQLMVEHKARG